jgi:hypothetical protein
VEAQATHLATEYEPALDGLSCTRTGDQSGVRTRRAGINRPEGVWVLGTSGDAVRIRLIRSSLRPEKDLNGRVYVRVNHSSESEPRPNSESAVLITDRDEASYFLGGAQGAVVEQTFRKRMKPTYRVRLRARLLLRAAIPDQGPRQTRRCPEDARRPATPGRCVPREARARLAWPRRRALPRAMRYVKPVTVGTETGAFLVTDAGSTWLGQDRWACPWWRRVFGR